MTIQSDHSRTSAGDQHPCRNERGGIREAMLMVLILGTVITYAVTHEPEINAQLNTENQDAAAFQMKYLSGWHMMQAIQKQYPLAFDQVAINAAQQGISFNACAETASCADAFNAGSDQNVPTANIPGGSANLAINGVNMQHYSGVTWTKFGKPWNPEVFGSVLPVWSVTDSMQANPPIGFWFAFAESPRGHAVSLKDFYAYKEQVLEGLPIRMFSGQPNALAVGAILDVSPTPNGGYNAPVPGDNDAFTTDTTGQGGQPAWTTFDDHLTYPMTGTSPALNIPSLYGLSPSVAGTWSPIMPNQEPNGATQATDGNILLAYPHQSIGVPYGYFLPAIMGVLSKGAPSGLALASKTQAGTTTTACPAGQTGSITNQTSTTWQLQTTGNVATPPQWVQVAQIITQAQNTCVAATGGTGTGTGGGGTVTPTCTGSAPVCNAGQTTITPAVCTATGWSSPVCGCTTAPPSPVCYANQVETALPVENTSNCSWTTSCTTATFANTATATPGTAESCTTGETLYNGYCVASNAYVANGYGDLGLGYTTLNLYNAVYSPNANGQYAWSGNIGIQIGGGTALQYGSLNAAFLNTPASSGTVTISNSETAVGPLGLSMLSGSGGGTFNNAYETPAQIAANGDSEVLSVILGGGPSAFSGAAPGTNVTLTGTSANGTTYSRELYNGPTTGPTTAALYFNNSGFYVFEQNPGACGSIYTGAAASGNLFVSGTPTTGATILGGQGCNAVAGGGCIPGPNGQCTNSYNAVVAQLTSDICTGTNTTTHPAAGTSACTTIVDAKAGPESSYTTPNANGGGAP